jgi:glycosyltransferase involved in cell wall biosynthesis
MRIVIDARESGTSTGRYVDKLIEYLFKLEPKHEVILLTYPQRQEFLNQIAPGFKTVITHYREFTFSEQLGFLRQIRKLKPDLVHFPLPQQPILYTGKTVTTMQDLTTLRFTNPAKNMVIFKMKQLVYALVIWVAAHKSKRLLAISQYTKSDVVKFTKIKPDKIVITYNAADKITEQPKSPENFKASSFLMYVGRPQPHKNLKRLMEAFSILQQTRPELKLVMAGKKDELYQRLEYWAQKEHINGLVFTDFVSEAELRWLYENCAAYVFPSLSEGFGLPGLEAMAHGAPVASSKATCLPEIYGDAAVYFDPTNVVDMANTVASILDDPGLAKELRTKGFEQVKKYSWQRLAERTLAVYEKVLR